MLRAKLHAADHIDWSRAVVDSRSLRAVGSKHHVLTDAQGIPLVALVIGAHRHDVTQLLPLLEAIPPVRGKRGRPRRRPDCVQGDRAYDSDPHRQELRALGITPVLATRGTAHGSGLGIHCWVVEWTLAWLPQWRRLWVHYARRADMHEALLTLECALICWGYLF